MRRISGIEFVVRDHRSVEGGGKVWLDSINESPGDIGKLCQSSLARISSLTDGDLRRDNLRPPRQGTAGLRPPPIEWPAEVLLDGRSGLGYLLEHPFVH